MNRRVILVAVGACAACAIVMASKRPRDTERPTMWDKMREHMEEMPEDFPPRVMFDNAQAARENTERILEVLQRPDQARDPEQRVEATV